MIVDKEIKTLQKEFPDLVFYCYTENTDYVLFKYKDYVFLVKTFDDVCPFVFDFKKNVRTFIHDPKIQFHIITL